MRKLRNGKLFFKLQNLKAQYDLHYAMCMKYHWVFLTGIVSKNAIFTTALWFLDHGKIIKIALEKNTKECYLYYKFDRDMQVLDIW